MGVGDLVKFEPDGHALYIGGMKDERRVGTIVGRSIWMGDEAKPSEPILEVLWNTGALGWILQSRVEMISESR